MLRREFVDRTVFVFQVMALYKFALNAVQPSEITVIFIITVNTNSYITKFTE